MTDTLKNDAKKNRDAQSEGDDFIVHPPADPVTRINRRVLFGVAGLLLLGLAGTVIIALDPPRYDSNRRREIVGERTLRPPEGLAKLPKAYDEIVAAPPLPPAPTLAIKPTGLLAPPSSIEVSNTRHHREALTSPIQFLLTAKPATTPPNGVASASSESATSAAVQRLQAAQAAATQGLTPLTESSGQTRKQTFARTSTASGTNRHALRLPASPYTLQAGTVIAASLLTGLSSDLPGFVIAQVTENVYDTVTGRHLLIPQGARLIGKYDSQVSVGQKRALVVWQRILLPDGTSLQVDNLPATDPAGYAGLKDRVDRHTWQLLQGVALATVLGVGSQLASGGTTGRASGSAADNDLVRALIQSTQSTTNRAGQRVVERQLNVQPTITVRPGWPLRVIVHQDLVLRPYPSSPNK